MINTYMKKKRTKRFDQILSRLVKKEQELKKLPQLSPPEKAKLESEIAIDHLYYSSKIEGTHLTDERIGKAIHGESTTPTQD